MKKKILSLACAVAMMATMFTSLVVNAATPNYTMTGSISKDNKTITVAVKTTYTTTQAFMVNVLATGVTLTSTNVTGSPAIANQTVKYNRTFKGVAFVFTDTALQSHAITDGNLGYFTVTLDKALTEPVTFKFKNQSFTDGSGTSLTGTSVLGDEITVSPNKEEEKVDAKPEVTVAADDTTAHSNAGYIWDVTVNPNTAKSNAAVTELKVKFTDSDSNVKETPVYGDISGFKGAGAIGFKVGLKTARTINSFEFSATNAVGTGSATWNK